MRNLTICILYRSLSILNIKFCINNSKTGCLFIVKDNRSMPES